MRRPRKHGTRRRPNLWCRFGLHRWSLGMDVSEEGNMVVAMCRECGLVEVVSE